MICWHISVLSTWNVYLTVLLAENLSSLKFEVQFLEVTIVAAPVTQFVVLSNLDVFPNFIHFYWGDFLLFLCVTNHVMFFLPISSLEALFKYFATPVAIVEQHDLMFSNLLYTYETQKFNSYLLRFWYLSRLSLLNLLFVLLISSVVGSIHSISEKSELL